MQYTTLSRTWRTDPPSSNQHSAGTSQNAAATQHSMTPMQRWENEPLRQSYYTNVAEYQTSTWTGGPNNGQGQSDASVRGQNWSLMGDEESERF